jgi:hypothetical protein
MKEINSHVLHQWAEELPKSWNDRKPMPFSGGHPTRVLFEVRKAGKDPFWWGYKGKPSRQAKSTFDSLLAKMRYHFGSPSFQCLEYDRGGYISLRYLQPEASIDTINTNYGLWDHYHRGLYNDGYCGWMLYPFKVDKHVYQLVKNAF